MADASLSDLTIRVLQKLSILAGGDTASAEDAALVQSAILAVNEKLRDLEVCYWTDSAFPLAIREDLAAYVGCHCAAELLPGTPELVLAFRSANETTSFNNLKRLSASRERIDVPTRADFS